MDDPALQLVLGQERVVVEAAEDPRRCRAVTGAGRVAAIWAYEPLYGPHAEGAVLAREDHSLAAIRAVGALVRAATRHDVVEVRFALDPHQLPFAARVAAMLGDARIDGETLLLRCPPVGRGEPRTATTVTPRWPRSTAGVPSAQ